MVKMILTTMVLVMMMTMEMNISEKGLEVW
jgi:hypothetical protein